MSNLAKRKEILLQDLQSDDVEIRRLSAEALERLQVRLSLERLKKVLQEGDMLDKIRIVYALSDLKGQDVIDVLASALKDPSEDVRAATVRSLGSMRDEAVLVHLVEALKDESPIVVRSAVDAIGLYTDRRIINPLMHALKSEDPGVVERAIAVIGRIGDKRAEDAMLYFAVKGNRRMKASAIRALGVMEA